MNTLSIKKAIKNKGVRRLLTIFCCIFIYFFLWYFIFLALDIKSKTISTPNDENSNNIELILVSPYISNLLVSILILACAFGFLAVLAFWLIKYKNIDNKYFNDNKKVYNAKIVMIKEPDKIFKKGSRFVGVEVLTDDTSTDKMHAIVELDYIPEKEGDIITIEYLAETNEAKYIKSN